MKEKENIRSEQPDMSSIKEAFWSPEKSYQIVKLF